MTKRDKRDETAELAARIDALAADVRALHDAIVRESGDRPVEGDEEGEAHSSEPDLPPVGR